MSGKRWHRRWRKEEVKAATRQLSRQADMAIRSNVSSSDEFKSPIRFVLSRKKQRNRQSDAALAAKRPLNRQSEAAYAAKKQLNRHSEAVQGVQNRQNAASCSSWGRSGELCGWRNRLMEGLRGTTSRSRVDLGAIFAVKIVRGRV